MKFEQELAKYSWEEIFNINPDVNTQVEIFHGWLRNNLDYFFPEKITKMSILDKKWMSPHLKQLHRGMQREFCKHRKSTKYKKLRSKFRKLKRKSVKTFYKDFVCNLKKSDPGKWYQMAKQIGAISESERGDIRVESLTDFTNKQCAQKIAEHYAAISNEYAPIDSTQLPCYLPAPPPPQVTEHDVYLRLNKIKKTKSTLPLDLPDKLRQECSPHLAARQLLIIVSLSQFTQHSGSRSG